MSKRKEPPMAKLDAFDRWLNKEADKAEKQAKKNGYVLVDNLEEALNIKLFKTCFVQQGRALKVSNVKHRSKCDFLPMRQNKK